MDLCWGDDGATVEIRSGPQRRSENSGHCVGTFHDERGQPGAELKDPCRPGDTGTRVRVGE